jgi:putative hemolysin
LEVRLAQTSREIRQAQRLRYRVFYKEMSATPTLSMSLLQRDHDAYDPICDHLLAIHRLPPNPFARRRSHSRIVGTYRLLLQEVAERHSGFYTQQEFDLLPLLQRHKGLRFLELGRSCVAKNYRDTRTLDLMWRGIVRYVCDHQVDVLIGCASFEGTDPKALALPLSFLYHKARATEEWAVHPNLDRCISMNLIQPEKIDEKKAIRSLPPLIRGYWRIGAVFGDGAVIDHQFGTIDVLVIVTRDMLIKRYGRHFPALNNR